MYFTLKKYFYVLCVEVFIYTNIFVITVFSHSADKSVMKLPFGHNCHFTPVKTYVKS